MSGARDILHRLADLGATVERHGDKLMVRAGNTPVPKTILTAIREHRGEVMASLTAPTSPAPVEVAPNAAPLPWAAQGSLERLSRDTGVPLDFIGQPWPAVAWQRLHRAALAYWRLPRVGRSFAPPDEAGSSVVEYTAVVAGGRAREFEFLAFSDLCDTWRRKHTATETNGTVAREGAAKALAGFGIKPPPGWEP